MVVITLVTQLTQVMSNYELSIVYFDGRRFVCCLSVLAYQPSDATSHLLVARGAGYSL